MTIESIVLVLFGLFISIITLILILLLFYGIYKFFKNIEPPQKIIYSHTNEGNAHINKEHLNDQVLENESHRLRALGKFSY
jgi:hypothetical protein